MRTCFRKELPTSASSILLAPFVLSTLVLTSQAVLAGQGNFRESVDARSMDVGQTDSTRKPELTPATRTTAERAISWKLLGSNVIQDQKSIWSFPLRVGAGQHLRPSLALGATTGVLIALDPYDEPYFRNSSGFDGFKTGVLRGRNTLLGVVVVPLGLYVGGVARHDSYAQQTALFIGESMADAEILSIAIKGITGRLRPSDIPRHGDFTHTWFKYKGGITSLGSFPSGHATVAFATASVLSSRYRRHRWVPWIAYTGATVVALSRIPDRAHFPSDVFVGAALGYVIGHFVVLPGR
jgi:membrane-associated phospholipid phosphatase